MDYLDIDDRDGFVSGLAREVDDERLVSIVKDVLVGRLRSKDDPVNVIRSAMESAALLQSAEEIRSYVDEGSPGEWFRMDYDDLEDGDWEDSP